MVGNAIGWALSGALSGVFLAPGPRSAGAAVLPESIGGFAEFLSDVVSNELDNALSGRQAWKDQALGAAWLTAAGCK